MTGPATDKHLDELSKRVDFGFDQTSQRLGRVEDDVRSLRTEMNARFDKVDDEFTAVRRFSPVSTIAVPTRTSPRAGASGVARP